VGCPWGPLWRMIPPASMKPTPDRRRGAMAGQPPPVATAGRHQAGDPSQIVERITLSPTADGDQSHDARRASPST